MIEPLIAICVPTYKRPKSLQALFESLRGLKITGFQVYLIIADNDPKGSAKATVEKFRVQAPFPVSYVREPARGLSSVRNRLVAEARSINAEFAAFIDDDEIADSNWLLNLYRQIVQSDADGVGGRQIFQFTDDTPASVRVCFRNPERVSGKPLASVSTANCIFRLAALDKVAGPFDLRLNLSGGEDSLLSAQLTSLGCTLIGSSEAITYEFIPPSRCTASWIIKRAYRVGTTRGKASRWVSPSPVSLIRSATVSGGLIIVSAVQLLFFLVVDRAQWLNRVRKIANGLGGLAALITTKASPSEYLEIHGK